VEGLGDVDDEDENGLFAREEVAMGRKVLELASKVVDTELDIVMQLQGLERIDSNRGARVITVVGVGEDTWSRLGDWWRWARKRR
jgi:hypothetical protein